MVVITMVSGLIPMTVAAKPVLDPPVSRIEPKGRTTPFPASELQ